MILKNNVLHHTLFLLNSSNPWLPIVTNLQRVLNTVNEVTDFFFILAKVLVILLFKLCAQINLTMQEIIRNRLNECITFQNNT